MRLPPRALLLALTLAVLLTAPAASARSCPACVYAGAATVRLDPPPGTPLAGYGGFERRALVPDVLDRAPHAFWLKPSEGELDPVAARALVLETAEAKLVWIAIDVVAVDRWFTADVREQLERAGLPPMTLIISASHTHSGPGAFGDSRFWAFVAADRFDAAVRAALVGRVVAAVRQAESRKVAARVGGFSVTAPPVVESRLGQPLDPEIVGLKVTSSDGAPIGLVWNYAIHGTTLGSRNRKLSGDVAGAASRALERDLGVPALFINGAVADVSPHRHGYDAALTIGDRLAATVRDGWSTAETRAEAAIAVRSARVALPAAEVSLRNCLGRWLPRVLKLPLGRMLPGDAELIAVSVGDTAWIAFPGELQTRLGTIVKQAAKSAFTQAFVAGLSNDYLAYFVTAGDYGRPSYVTCANLYGPDAGDHITRAAVGLVHQLVSGPTDRIAAPRPNRPPFAAGSGGRKGQR